MSPINSIKNVREALSREVSAAKKSHEKLSNDLRALTATVKANEATIEAKVRFLSNLDAILRETDGSVLTTRRGPGRKPKAEKNEKNQKSPKTEKTEKASAKVLTAEVKVRKKPGPKPKAEKALASSKPTAKADKKANGRPSTKEAISRVLSNRSMTIDEVYEALRAKSWLPNSSDPRGYVGYLLSTTKDRFERVKGSRGVYRAKTVAAPVAVAPAVPGAGLSTDEILANAGVLGDAVFGG